MSRVEDQMLLMFDHPTEPIYVPKGDDKVSFNIPPTYLPDNYQPIAQRILTRFGNESNSTVRIKQIAVPDLSVPLKLPRNAGFSNMIPSHRSMAGHLTSLFMGMRTVEDLLSLAAYCHDRINPQMFVYSLSVALINRPDTKGIRIPQLTEVFPHKFVDSNVFARASEMVNIVPEGSRMPIEIPLNWTASDVDPEHRVAYFREDVGINLHHWHWHLIYPMDGPMVVVNKDRRGELFYHMHHQIMARYNVERLCNGLPLAVPLVDLREQIPEAYFPKMDQTVAGRAWPARVANMVLSNLNRRVDGVQLALTDLEKWRNNIYDAIASGRVTNTQGQVIVLDEVKGIDVLGNIVESSIISPNSAVYGDLHNQGHLALAYIHDPDHRYLESFGIMGDTATAMRDPVFYRWHQFVDNIFTQFKNTLQPYTAQTLNFPGISLTDIRITSDGANPNTLNCYWSKSDIDLSRGLDFSPRGSVFTRIQHLNHDEFSYTLQVNNTNNSDLTGTVRIFIGPKFDLNGYPLSFNQQRQLMIEMDKFTARLNRGQNTINRTSVQSNLTIPFEATFRDLSQNRPATTDIQGSESFNFCGCGWPHHMLCPKGNAAGYQMDLFIMISDYRIDQVKQASPTGCTDGISFCGLRDLRYPDTRAMGFPFDRSSPQGVRTISEFLTPNMRLQSITVRFTDTIRPRQQVTKARKRTG